MTAWRIIAFLLLASCGASGDLPRIGRTMDPLVWFEQQKLVAPNPTSGDHFGSAVSVDGDTALIGASWTDQDGADSGSAFVFVRTGDVWMLQQTLTASDSAAGRKFGNAVSIDGDTALIGCSLGPAYVFVRSGTVWSETQQLLPIGFGEAFGASVSMSGDTALIGAPLDDAGQIDTGSAFVYVRSGSTWTEQQKLTRATPTMEDEFGNAVSLSGDTALVGAHYDDSGALPGGAAYTFVRSGTVWTEQQVLTGSDQTDLAAFGHAVSVDGDTALVGTLTADAAYVFVRSGSVWTEQQKLTAADATDGFFATSVSVNGDAALIGAFDEGDGSGAAYVFTRSGSVWGQTQKLKAADASDGAFFGSSVALRGDTALIGANNDGLAVGAAYLFHLEPELMNGESCGEDVVCLSGHCVDGVCCDGPCGGGAADCQACSAALTNDADGTCAPAVNLLCRAATGECDLPDACDGLQLECPADAFVADGTMCDGRAGECRSGHCEPLVDGGGGAGGTVNPIADAVDEEGCGCRVVGASRPGESDMAALFACLVITSTSWRRRRTRCPAGARLG